MLREDKRWLRKILSELDGDLRDLDKFVCEEDLDEDAKQSALCALSDGEQFAVTFRNFLERVGIYA